MEELENIENAYKKFIKQADEFYSIRFNDKDFRQRLHREIIKSREEYKRNEKKKEEKKIIKEYERD